MAGGGRPRRHIGALVAALVTLAVFAAGASAAWTGPQSISPAGQDAAEAKVAMDGAGDAVIVWRRFDGSNWRVAARRRSAGGVLGPTKAISTAGGDAGWPDVAVDPDGDATLVWNRFDGTDWQIQTRAWSSDGALSSIRNLGTAGGVGTQPTVGVDPVGNATVVWDTYIRREDPEEPCFCLQARRRNAGGTLGPIQSLYGGDATDAHVAVDADGEASIVWLATDNLQYQIIAAWISGAGVAEGNAPLSGLTAEWNFDPWVAVDPAGDGIFVWRKEDADTGKYYIALRARPAGGSLGRTRRLSPVDRDAQVPKVAVDPNGNAVIAWEFYDGAHWRIQARLRHADGTFGSTRSLSAAGQDAHNPQVGVDQNGKAVIVWERGDGSNVRIQSRAGDVGGTLGPVQTISDAGDDATGADVAVAPLGEALATWLRSDGSNVRVQGSVGP